MTLNRHKNDKDRLGPYKQHSGASFPDNIGGTEKKGKSYSQ